MRSHLRAGALLACAALFTPAAARAADRSTASGDAASLVHQALEAELNGADRAAILSEALAMDPNCAAARWQLGYVRIGDQWIKVDDVPQEMADDARLAAYRKRRDALVDTADNQRQMARWCLKNKLPAEARVHWAKLLEFEPQNAEALTALGLEWYEGRLMTRSQIVAERGQAAERNKAYRHWHPQFVRWRAALLGSNSAKADEALAGLAQLDDPAALPSLESVFGATAASDDNNRLNLLLIRTAARMMHPDATAVLVRCALIPNAQDVRLAACQALKKRPMHVYVPQLIAAMPGKTETKFAIYMLPNGAVVHEHKVSFDSQQGKQTVTFESSVLPTDISIAPVVAPRALVNEATKAQIIERNAQLQERIDRPRRERVQFALQHTTGFENADDPELWSKRYAEYYGWSESGQPKPEREAHYWQLAAYYPIPEPSTNSRTDKTKELPTTTSSPSRPATPAVPTLQVRRQAHWDRGFGGECFPAGTPVVTATGPQPIESLRPGDRVLSQDLDSGELAYKTVLNRTLRPGVKLVRVSFGDEALVATFGHPFWVVGRGWQVAGHLEPGMQLRGLEHNLAVDKVEQVPAKEVYNLVVSDFATYFVGSERLLVHDDSPLANTAALSPGLVADASGD